MSEELITQIYNAFNPFEPLKPGDKAYVDFKAVRGNEDIFRQVGRKIIRSDQPTCQLYTGHRGAGKSTELLRLQKYLEENGCFVVYFGATENDLNEQDSQHTDILLACTRHVLEQLKDSANPQVLLKWLEERWFELKDLAFSEVSWEGLNVEAKIPLFAKLTGKIRRISSTRENIRKIVDLHSISLTDALNEFIAEASKNLPEGKRKLVVIADNLDRLVPVPRPDGRNNHDEIFLDQCSQLKALNCHLIYTVPISLVYSNRATEIRDNYDTPQVLPMVMVRSRSATKGSPDGNPYQPGIDKFKELIERRINPFCSDRSLDGDIFDSLETRLQLCIMSGGHFRDLMLLIQSAIDWTDELPISSEAVQKAIDKARDTSYRAAVDNEDWNKLAQVFVSKRILHEEEYRDLLFRRCVLEYRQEGGSGNRWYDVHPLIEDTTEFQDALNKVGSL